MGNETHLGSLKPGKGSMAEVWSAILNASERSTG